MQRFGVTDLGPVANMTTDRVGPLLPRVPKMRRNPLPKQEPILSVTIEKPIPAKKPVRKTVHIVESVTKDPLIQLPPPTMRKKVKSPVRKIKPTNLVSVGPPRKKNAQKELPKRFTGKETARLIEKPILPAVLKNEKGRLSAAPGKLDISREQTKLGKSKAAPLKVRWK